MATVFSPRLAAMSISPSRYTSAADCTMNTNLRPFLKIEVVDASGATMGISYFSLTLATASVIGDEYGTRIASTLICVMSLS